MNVTRLLSAAVLGVFIPLQSALAMPYKGLTPGKDSLTRCKAILGAPLDSGANGPRETIYSFSDQKSGSGTVKIAFGKRGTIRYIEVEPPKVESPHEANICDYLSSNGRYTKQRLEYGHSLFRGASTDFHLYRSLGLLVGSTPWGGSDGGHIRFLIYFDRSTATQTLANINTKFKPTTAWAENKRIQDICSQND